MGKWSMTKVTLEHSGENMIFLIKGTALIGYLFDKKCITYYIYIYIYQFQIDCRLNVKDKITLREKYR